ncbi:MAG: dockerin type I repeat-containing protein [Clostridia bacterium]|nr:dockerin type I repeat-containing protein [Clostridia bacterium]
MKNKNKIIAIVVAAVLIISAFIVGTVANTNSASVSITIDKTELSAGETATVTVKSTTNFPVATASIPVFYDKTLVSVSNITATLTDYAISNVTTDATATDSSKIYANTEIDSSKYGFVLVTYIGGANDTVATVEEATILMFTITAKTDMTGNALIKCITESAKTEDNVAGMLYFGTTTSGTKITSIPENVENVNLESASSSIMIVDGDAELIAKDGKSPVIDKENKYVYGITPGTDIETYFTVKNGTLELVANSAGYKNGTGATINVKNSSGAVIDTYTVIIFGDVDGDGVLSGTDALYIKQYAGGNIARISEEVNLSAADADNDAVLSGTDALKIKQYVGGNESAVLQIR